MRPVDFQPPVIQSLNVERQSQQEIAQRQVNQQSFAQQLERTAGERPTQVQAPDESQQYRKSEISEDQRQERPEDERQRGRRDEGRDQGEHEGSQASEPPAPGAGKSRIDIVV